MGGLRNLKDVLQHLGADKWKRAGQIIEDYGVKALFEKVRERMDTGVMDPALLENPYFRVIDSPPPRKGSMAEDSVERVAATVTPNASNIAALEIGTVASDDNGILHIEIYDREKRVLNCLHPVGAGENTTFVSFPPIILGTPHPLTILVAGINAKIARTLKQTRSFLDVAGGGRIYVRIFSHVDPIYALWQAANDLTPEELAAQADRHFESGPLFSIVVPLYNTPETYLREMIDSVRSQTYSLWELCLADGSTDGVNRQAVCASFEDERIKYTKLGHNAGIVGNTNEGMKMASGDYICLLDHDDLLAPQALYANADLIDKDPSCEFIYSDEDKLTAGSGRRFLPFFKPDYSPDFLDGNNYITHFSVFSKRLLDEVGGLREGFDGSQDYDLILRLTEKAKKVGHIRDILYHWRAASTSTASTATAKTYTQEASMKALRESLTRRGCEGATVTTNVLPNTFQISYPLAADPPSVSIVMADWNGSDMDLSSLLDKTSYPNCEIVLVTNNADIASSDDRVRTIAWQGPFHPAKMLNAGAQASTGELLVFLDASARVVDTDWLEKLVRQILRDDIGVATGTLLRKDDMVCQAGLVLYHDGIVAPAHAGYAKNDPGSFCRTIITNNLSAASCACLMVSKTTTTALHGFDERYPGYLFDADFCARVQKQGQRILFVPGAKLCVADSLLTDRCSGEQKAASDALWLCEHEIAPDPFYSPNWTFEGRTYGIEPGKAVTDVAQRLREKGLQVP